MCSVWAVLGENQHKHALIDQYGWTDDHPPLQQLNVSVILAVCSFFGGAINELIMVFSSNSNKVMHTTPLEQDSAAAAYLKHSMLCSIRWSIKNLHVTLGLQW